MSHSFEKRTDEVWKLMALMKRKAQRAKKLRKPFKELILKEIKIINKCLWSIHDYEDSNDNNRFPNMFTEEAAKNV